MQLTVTVGHKQGVSVDASELECLQSLVQSAKEKYERERNSLYKDLEGDGHLGEHFARDKQGVEALLSRGQAHLERLVRELAASWTQRPLSREGQDFLTEEEAAIRRISERIGQVKARMTGESDADRDG